MTSVVLYWELLTQMRVLLQQQDQQPLRQPFRLLVHIVSLHGFLYSEVFLAGRRSLMDVTCRIVRATHPFSSPIVDICGRCIPTAKTPCEQVPTGPCTPQTICKGICDWFWSCKTLHWYSLDLFNPCSVIDDCDPETVDCPCACEPPSYSGTDTSNICDSTSCGFRCPIPPTTQPPGTTTTTTGGPGEDPCITTTTSDPCDAECKWKAQAAGSLFEWVIVDNPCEDGGCDPCAPPNNPPLEACEVVWTRCDTGDPTTTTSTTPGPTTPPPPCGGHCVFQCVSGTIGGPAYDHWVKLNSNCTEGAASECVCPSEWYVDPSNPAPCFTAGDPDGGDIYEEPCGEATETELCCEYDSDLTCGYVLNGCFLRPVDDCVYGVEDCGQCAEFGSCCEDGACDQDITRLACDGLYIPNRTPVGVGGGCSNRCELLSGTYEICGATTTTTTSGTTTTTSGPCGGDCAYFCDSGTWQELFDNCAANPGCECDTASLPAEPCIDLALAEVGCIY